MSASIEQISIRVLEALEGEWRLERDLLKCRLASEVLGPLKSAHQIVDADITEVLHFALERGYITVVTRPDGQAVLPSIDGLAILAKIQLARLFGHRQVLQVSGDLNNWTNQGSAFTATNTSMVYPQYFDVDNWNQLFFRLQVAP